ncbi:alpha-mannosidase [Verrucomicrobiota bacterium]
MAREDSTVADPGHVVEALKRKAGELNAPLPLTWRYAPGTCSAPLDRVLNPRWPVYDRFSRLRPGRKNWLYADLVLPKTKAGHRLSESQVLCFVLGSSPFTLWIDGEEQFREQHEWHATGPIADPLPVSPAAGEPVRLAACIVPSGERTSHGPLWVLQVHPGNCMETATHVAAAAAQLEIAGVLARSAAEKRLVARGAEALDIDALSRNNWPRFRSSAKRMEQALSSLSPRAKAVTVHLLGTTHMDMDWLWTWEDTVDCVRRDFRAVTDVLADFPEATFLNSQVPTYQIVQEADPEVFREVQALVAEGRWENTAGTWVEGDLNMADGEATVRQIQYASDWARENLGRRPTSMWQPDTFGHPGNMPQIAKLGEIDAYFHMRCNPGNRDGFMPIRLWEGFDGSRVCAFSFRHEGCHDPMSYARSLEDALDAGLTEGVLRWGIGDHGGGLARFHLELLELFRDRPLIPSIRFSTMPRLMGRLDDSMLPVSKGQHYSVFEGCFTTQTRIKAANRECEGACMTAETLSVLAGLDRRKQAREAWIPALFNQFHDIMDGTSIDEAYSDAAERAEQSLRTSRGIAEEALVRIVPRAKKGRHLVLVNPLGFSRTEPVRTALPAGTTHLLDERERAVPVQRLDDGFVFIAADVPAFARKSYRVMQTPCPSSHDVAVSDTPAVEAHGQRYYCVETGTAIARISKLSGVICQYYDKRLDLHIQQHAISKFMSSSPFGRAELGMNVFQYCEESPWALSAWNMCDILRQENLLRGAKVELLDRGPLFARFRIRHRFRKSTIREEVVFYNHLPRVDFHIDIDWRERGDQERRIVPMLRIGFGSSATGTHTLSEGPFSVVKQPADGQEYPTQKWASLRGEHFGCLLLNDSRYGYGALGPMLRMTLVRSAYDPAAATDIGRHGVNLAFVPHAPDYRAADCVRQGMAFNRKLIPVLTDGPALSCEPYLRMEGARNVVCSALRLADHSDETIVRFYETEGRGARLRFSLGRGARSARETNFLENTIGSPVRIERGKVFTRFRPYEIKTFALRGSAHSAGRTGLAGVRSCPVCSPGRRSPSSP